MPTWGFVTDVEGDLDFWSRFCALSSVLQGGVDDLTLRPGCHLVFGGDSVDKGGHDLAFLRSLLALKERHTDRVHLILGNRDVNKMRLPAELAERHWLPADRHPGVYWRRSGDTATPAGWLAARTAPLPPTPHARAPPVADGPESRLRWMLEDNMGSLRAFEHRRNELAEAETEAEAEVEACGAARGKATDPEASAASEAPPPSGPEVRVISDTAVLRSYLGSLSPGGELRRLLQQGQACASLHPSAPTCTRRLRPVYPSRHLHPRRTQRTRHPWRQQCHLPPVRPPGRRLPRAPAVPPAVAAQLCCLLGDALFVHGGLKAEAIGLVPPRDDDGGESGDSSGRDGGDGGGNSGGGNSGVSGGGGGGGGGVGRVLCVQDWVEAMNGFAAAEVAAWCADIDVAAGPSWRGGADRAGEIDCQ